MRIGRDERGTAAGERRAVRAVNRAASRGACVPTWSHARSGSRTCDSTVASRNCYVSGRRPGLTPAAIQDHNRRSSRPPVARPTHASSESLRRGQPGPVRTSPLMAATEHNIASSSDWKQAAWPRCSAAKRSAFRASRSTSRSSACFRTSRRTRIRRDVPRRGAAVAAPAAREHRPGLRHLQAPTDTYFLVMEFVDGCEPQDAHRAPTKRGQRMTLGARASTS